MSFLRARSLGGSAGVRHDRESLGGTEDVLVTDDQENAAAARENGSLLIQDFGGVSETAAALADVLGPDFERAIQRHWTQIFDGHSRGRSRGIEEPVHLRHGFVENGRDHATVTISGRTGVAFAETKAADELSAGFVQLEFQAHAGAIVASATKTEILFARMACAGAMAVPVISILCHGCARPFLVFPKIVADWGSRNGEALIYHR